MGESVRPRFEPQIIERDRQLPLWVAPQIQASDSQSGVEGSTTTARAICLNPSAAAIRDLCDGGRSIFQIVEALRQRYVAEDVELYVDVTSAVLELRRLGLIGWAAVEPSARPPTKFVVGIEDKTYFHWQLPILFESLIGQLPKDWEILVVVCNDHKPLSDALLHIFERYGIRHLTGANHPAKENMDFADGGDQYAPLNRIEALRVVAPHVRDEDMVFLLDTDNFLYDELDLGIFPKDNAVYANEIIDHRPFFTHSHGGRGVDLQKLLKSIGCQNRFGAGGVAVFLTGRTVKNEKFVQDCFRFTQVVYLLGKIAGLQARTAWISEMPSFALALTANGIPYQVIESQSFMVDKAASVPSGTFYHYYGDLKDTSIDGAFYDSDWHKQLYFNADFLNTNLEEQFLAAVTPHEQYFYELGEAGTAQAVIPECEIEFCRGGASLIYTVFSTTDSPFQQWQSELLEYSWSQVGQPGELIRLVAAATDTLPVHRYARTIGTPSWQVHPLTGDDYGPYNKPASLLHWLRTEQPEGTVLLVDPDCVFQEAICREVAEGKPVAQKWIGIAHDTSDEGFALDRRFAFLETHGVRPQTPAQLGMIPTLIHTRDLERIAARWLEVTALVRQEVADQDGRRMWESDMFAYAIVTAEAGLVHELTSLGICTNWSPDDAVDAPIIHYCQAIEGKGGESIWSKYDYKPWRRVAEPARARYDYGRNLLTLVNRCVNARAGAELEGVRPRGRVGVREIREATGTVLCAPGSNREFSLNRAAERIWALCDGGRTVNAIRGELEREFESGDGKLYEVLIETLATFHDANLLVFERG